MKFPPDESGYESWLRYPKTDTSESVCSRFANLNVYCEHEGTCVGAAKDEWQLGIERMTGKVVRFVDDRVGAGVVFSRSSRIASQGFEISVAERLEISASDDSGLLYGVFACLRMIQCGRLPESGVFKSAPEIGLRLLNHWDNLVEDPVMGSIERVWGGKTIFDWTDLSRPNPRYKDYARMLASVGINGSCINNVNATAEIISTEMLPGLSSLAEIFRALGIRLFISIDYASPVDLSGLDSADPLDPKVQDWWCKKIDEIYAAIPDFGGFVVKADSEGRPGPGDYGRTHTEGSQCLARPLARHGGILFWRAFVYGRDIADRAPHAKAAADRANHASYEFMGLDGEFDDNVILQIKCSATDFQIWEPPHALFGKMPQSRLALEFDLAHEYTGYDVHLAWEAPYFSRVLNFEALHPEYPGRIADIIAGKSANRRSGAITAVANISSSRNWFGHLLGGAGLFAYGRLSWDSSMDIDTIASEYAELMFGPEAREVVSGLLKSSYNVFASYTSPYGLHYMWEQLHHFDPDPWSTLHSAGIDGEGVGRDRTSATGSGHTSLYAPWHTKVFEDPMKCPEEYLLYFHHLHWKHPMADGRTLIQALYDSFYQGAEAVGKFRLQWRELHGQIDLARWAHVYEKFAMQQDHAERWRDILCRFFLEYTKIGDEQKRFDFNTPSRHARVRSGFPVALEDYIARVARRRSQMGAKETQHANYA